MRANLACANCFLRRCFPMKAECKGCLLIAAGVFLGVGAYALVKSGAAKKATVKALAKGIELQEKAACAAEKAIHTGR